MSDKQMWERRRTNWGRRLQAAHGQTNRQTDRTWGDAATYRGVKEFQNSLQVKVAAAT
jgi:hypothetical protein